MTCENCGLPEYAVNGEGRRLQVTRRAENNFRRDRKVTVWCCSDDCATQTLAVAKYGNRTSTWPITLAQFRATKPLEGVNG